MRDIPLWIDDPLKNAALPIDGGLELGQRPLNTIPAPKCKDRARLGNIVNYETTGPMEGIALETTTYSGCYP
ncbi:MAG: hypothetical protein GY842_18310 [bacterium]|nr:hypothetical protein [bacterium]